MEFVDQSEVMGILREYGVTPEITDEEHVYLRMAERPEVSRMCFVTPESECEPEPGARRIEVEAASLPEKVEGLIHKLHLSEVLLFPVGRWRTVFDAVAFSLAENEEWQEFEATASLKLNSRDPLMCEPADYHALVEFVRALLSDAEQPDQGILMASTAAPMLVELVPPGCLRMAFGSQVIADEVAEALVT